MQCLVSSTFVGLAVSISHSI